ncbi:hypothetical protein CAPTEDRAFT_217816 [Capitella teleta]|uniref:Reverse transcriptase domain-containing protein n=1 Tax=Capitella teleta TaxID=283909 RepID=R7TMW1_CAPTE|nr:hypothetical protein CAPTEDRAFT_217816 [Capitella teleta]|eukprot:ELT94979.1 hypothetical protein CAPTEDRAFT_217816 [Capitella teleta]
MANNCSRDFFAEMKKLNPKPSASSSVNGLDSEEEIAKFFSKKYSALYNSVESDPECMASILNQINTGAGKCPLGDHCISFTVVQEAVRKLKQGKRDGDKDLVSNHLLLVSPLFLRGTAALLTAAFKHGHQPSALLRATIMSISKNLAKSLTDGENYRGIALSSSLAKFFDLVFLQRNSMHLRTSDLQFAFKKAFSTSMCTLALKRLREADDECWMGHTYFGVLVYADNITLLTPTRGRPKPDVKLGGSGLEWSRSVKHLGSTLTENLNEEDEMMSILIVVEVEEESVMGKDLITVMAELESMVLVMGRQHADALRNHSNYEWFHGHLDEKPWEVS